MSLQPFKQSSLQDKHAELEAQPIVPEEVLEVTELEDKVEQKKSKKKKKNG